MTALFACAALNLCFLQACASQIAVPPPQSEAAKRQVQHDFLKCAIQHEREMDDGISDASTVALALTNRCAAEYQAETNIWFTGSREAVLQWKRQRAAPQAKVQASLDVALLTRRGAVPNPDF
jgi:hypothetical protein